MVALDVGKRHLDNKGIQYGHYQDDEEEYKLDAFWTTSIVQWIHGVHVSTQVNLFEKLNLTSFFGLQAKHFVEFNLSRKLHYFKW
jgi:hypothetical protein